MVFLCHAEHLFSIKTVLKIKYMYINTAQRKEHALGGTEAFSFEFKSLEMKTYPSNRNSSIIINIR